MAHEFLNFTHEASHPAAHNDLEDSFLERPAHLVESNTTHHTTTNTHRVHSQSRIAQFASAASGAFDSIYGANEYANNNDDGGDGDLSSDSNSDDSNTSARKRHKKSRHTHDQSHHENHPSSNATFGNADGPDQGDQYRRPSWSDHVATCESCASLPGIDSSRPSTLRATSSFVTTTEHKGGRSSSMMDTIARSGTPKRTSAAQKYVYLEDTNELSEESEEESSANGATRRSAQAREMSSLPASKHIIDVRTPNGTIVHVNGTIVTIREDNEASHLPAAASRKAHHDVKGTQTERSGSKRQVSSRGMKNRMCSEKCEHCREEVEPEAIEPQVTVQESGENNRDGNIESNNNRASGAQVLMRRTSRWVQILIWTIMIVVPLVFIVLGILNAVIAGKAAPDYENSEFGVGQTSGSDLGSGVLQANRVAVTIWPIVFAAMIAQSLRMYASYRAERGVSLMTLEQLIGSHSVASVIKQPFIFRRPNWTTLILLCLWSLSPLAGQAFLRVSYTDSSNSQSTTNLQYVNISGQSVVFGRNDAEATLRDGAPNVNLLFGSSIIGSMTTQQASSDSWNNAKIPVLEKLPEDSRRTNSSDWHDVEFAALGSSLSPFSSLLGVPVNSLPNLQGKEADLNVSSSYFLLDCQAFEQINNDQMDAISNATNITLHESNSGTLYIGFGLPENGKPGSFLFFSLKQRADDTHENLFAYSNCTFNQSYVESQVSCLQSGCAVEQIRRDPTPALYTPNAPAFQDMLEDWANSGGDFNSTQYTPTELFLNDPTTADSFSQTLDLSQVPISNFTDRLTLLFNTYWQAGVAPFDFAGGNHNPDATIDPLIQVNATIVNTTQVYHTSWGWLAVLLVASVILLVAGIAGVIWDSRTVGPNVFGYASSLLPRNRYVKLSGRGGTIGGSARARALRDTRVMLQDVRPDGDVGKIALATVDGGGQRLRLGRLYR